jgi:hypothetical protein
MREYGRTAGRPGMDPNDRHYDRALERELKALPAEKLDALLHGDRAFAQRYSTVTVFARFRGLATSRPRRVAMA